jgi:hypothetical protein
VLALQTRLTVLLECKINLDFSGYVSPPPGFALFCPGFAKKQGLDKNRALIKKEHKKELSL